MELKLTQSFRTRHRESIQPGLWNWKAPACIEKPILELDSLFSSVAEIRRPVQILSAQDSAASWLQQYIYVVRCAVYAQVNRTLLFDTFQAYAESAGIRFIFLKTTKFPQPSDMMVIIQNALELDVVNKTHFAQILYFCVASAIDNLKNSYLENKSRTDISLFLPNTQVTERDKKNRCQSSLQFPIQQCHFHRKFVFRVAN